MSDYIKPGELQIKKAMEEVTTRNVSAAIQHSNETRRLFRALEIKINTNEQIIRSQNEKINNLQKQVSALQARLYIGGTVSGDQH